jgi:hypothetical protein
MDAALSAGDDAAGRARLAANWGNLPLRFEKNSGQSDPRVQYLARGGSYNVFLDSTGAYFVLDGPASPEPPRRRNAFERMREAQRRAAERVAVRMEIAGANPAASAEPLDELETRSNYFIGNDPAQWRTNIVNYGKVCYRDVYPGVDLVYYGNQKQLEYDFVLAPGRDPGMIRLRLTGANAVEVNAAGELVLEGRGSELRQQKPRAYQWAGGEQRSVDARYRVRGEEVRFEVGSYDPSLPLTIDPALTWSTFFGGGGDETAFGITVGPGGNIFITGVSSSANLPVTAGVIQPARNGALEDAFVAKLNGAGTAILFCTYLGGHELRRGRCHQGECGGQPLRGRFHGLSQFSRDGGSRTASVQRHRDLRERIHRRAEQ